MAVSGVEHLPRCRAPGVRVRGRWQAGRRRRADDRKSAQLLGAFPDYVQAVNARHVTEGVLVVEAVASGTSNGEPPSPGLPSPRTGTRIQLPYVKVLRFEDGLIRDDRQYHDAGSLVAQLYPESRAS